MVSIYYVNLGLARPLLTRTVYFKRHKNIKFVYSMLIQFEESELKKIWEFKFRFFEINNSSREGALYVNSWTRIPKTSRPRFYRFIEFIPKKLLETEPGWDEVYVLLEMIDSSGIKKDEKISNSIKVKI